MGRHLREESELRTEDGERERQKGGRRHLRVEIMERRSEEI